MSRIIAQLMYLQMQIRIFHWQTKKYSRHKAFGKFYDAMDGLLDKFVEVYQGQTGRVAFNQTLDLKNMDESIDLDEVLVRAINMLTTEMEQGTSTDLLNIRDEILGEINRLRYLLTLE
jgi:hypothetical protein